MAEKSSKKGFVIRKEKLLLLVCGIVTLVILFLPWMKTEGIAITLFMDNIGDASGVLGFTKVMAIITVVVSCFYILCQLFDIEKIVPGLKKFKFGFYRLLGLVYYGLLEFVALFAIIGSISCDYTDPTVRVFILFVIFAVGILRFALPKVYNNVVKKLNITLE